MSIYIYGAGNIGEKLLKKMNKYEISLDGFMDSYKEGEFLNYPILPITEIDKNSIVVISVLNTSSILSIYKTLCSNGIVNIYWFKDFSDKSSKLGLEAFLENECVSLVGWGDLIMPHVELHISDKCNLNCRGCTHFSPLFDEIGAVFEEKMEDIRKLKRLFPEIFRIDVLGGEPLLNPDLAEYVIALRKELPKTFIQIYTNGLLIPQLSEDILKIIYENNIGVSISEYAPTHKIIDKITNRLEEYEIHYRIAAYDSKQKFNTPVSTNANSKYPKLCISDGCITVNNGMIARCPTLMYISKFNEYFQQNLPTEGIYKLDDYTDGNLLLKDMEKEVPLCKHCIQKDIEWSICDKEKHFEDFAVSE